MAEEAEPRSRRGARTAAAALRRLPFTLATAAVILIVGLAVGGLWDPVSDRSWYPDVAYGLPSFEQGHWWTLLIGPAFCATPLEYLPVLVGLVVLAGLAELRMGTRRAAAVTAAGQLGAVLLAAGLLAVLRHTSWSWAEDLARLRDVGISAGFLCAGAVATATLASPWRQRLRLALLAYTGVALLYLGGLNDLEHALAVGGGLAATHWLRVPGAAPASGRLGRREWRLLATAGLLLVAAVLVVVRLVPSRSPVGDTAGLGDPWWQVLLFLLVVALLVNGLRRGSRTAWRWSVLLCLLNVLLGLLVAVVYVIGKALDEEVTVTGAAVFVPTAVIWTAELVVLLAGRDAFRARRGRARRGRARAQAGAVDADPRERAARVLEREGGANLSWMTTWPDNSYFFPADHSFPADQGPDGSGGGAHDRVPAGAPGAAGGDPGSDPTGGPDEGYLAYRVHAGVAVALGDPVGAADGRARSITGFAGMCDHAGLVPCLFSATPRAVETGDRLGWRSVQVAEDTVIDLPDLEFRGKAWQDVRTALNRAKKEGVEYRLAALAEEPRQVLAQVRGISEEWVGDMGLPEMGFTLGGVEEALDPRMRVGLALGADGHVHGVTSWMPVYAGGAERVPHGWTLDMMRRRHDGFRPVVEFMIASSCLALREDGARFLSLSGAPLARTGPVSAPTVLDRILDQLGGAMEPYYGFRSLHSFKAKFRPRHEPLHLIYRDEADLPRIGVALLRCYLPTATVRDLLTAPARRG